MLTSLYRENFIAYEYAGKIDKLKQLTLKFDSDIKMTVQS